MLLKYGLNAMVVLTFPLFISSFQGSWQLTFKNTKVNMGILELKNQE